MGFNTPRVGFAFQAIKGKFSFSEAIAWKVALDPMGQGHLSKEELDGGMNLALLSPSSSHYLVVNLAMESPLYLSLSIDDFPRKKTCLMSRGFRLPSGNQTWPRFIDDFP